MAKERIRVYCVDDHEATTAFYRLALELEPDMEFVGSCTSTADLLQGIDAAHASVLLLDLCIPGCDTLATLRSLRARCPSLTILVASGLEAAATVEEVFRLGANGFFLKGMDLTDLTSIIRRAVAGERVNTGPRPTGPVLRWLGGPRTGN